jgi:hypothetical protein
MHWDFMLEHKGQLLTWALSEPPAASVEIATERLSDHRLEYLQFEGPVSGDRGDVSQWDHGMFDWLSYETNRVDVNVTGQRLRGRVVLIRTSTINSEPDPTWLFTYDPSVEQLDD